MGTKWHERDILRWLYDRLSTGKNADNTDFLLPTSVASINLNPADIQLGAIELKDDVASTRANVKTDGTNNALVVVQNVQPLPTGAATATKQDTGNTSLGSIDGKLPALSGGKVPIIASSLPLPSGAATEASLTSVGSSLSSLDTKTPALVNGKIPVAMSPAFNNRGDTFTATGSGTTIDASGAPVKSFAIQVKGTGASATTWDVRLEGSLDNTTWTQIIQHTNTDSDGTVKWQLAGIATPILYFRSRCAGLVLGGASAVVATILGVD